MILQSILLIAIGILASAAPAYAQDQPDCAGLPQLSSGETGVAQVVRGTRPVYLQASGARAGECPGPGESCRTNTYVVPGDKVITYASYKEFACAAYVDRKGRLSSGWLAESALSPLPVVSASGGDWAGHWSRPGAEIDIAIAARTSERAIKGEMTIKADAIHNSIDPAGHVAEPDTGGFTAANLKPDGDKLSFAMDASREDHGRAHAIPVTMGASFDCRVWLQRVGPWLLVDDDNQCGGVNVTFRGLYRRRHVSIPSRTIQPGTGP